MYNSRKFNTLLPATTRKIENVYNTLHNLTKEVSWQDIEKASYLLLALPIRYRKKKVSLKWEWFSF